MAKGAGGGASAGSAAPAAASGGGVQRVEVVLVMPAGMSANVRGNSPGVTVIARTGPAMASSN